MNLSIRMTKVHDTLTKDWQSTRELAAQCDVRQATISAVLWELETIGVIEVRLVDEPYRMEARLPREIR